MPLQQKGHRREGPMNPQHFTQEQIGMQEIRVYRSWRKIRREDERLRLCGRKRSYVRTFDDFERTGLKKIRRRPIIVKSSDWKQVGRCLKCHLE
jgi:hypothetical protein